MKTRSNLSSKEFTIIFLSFTMCSILVFFVMTTEHNVFAASGTLVATTIDQYSVRLTWEAPSNIPDDKTLIDYEIRYKETIEADYLTFNDGVSLNTSTIVTNLKKGTSYDFQVKAIFSPSGKSNIGETSASTPKIDAIINTPPSIEGIGFYEIVIYDKALTELETKPANFQDYFPYATFSDSLDLQNYGTIGKYRKEGFYLFTQESKTISQTFYGQTDNPIQIQVRLKDEESSQNVQTVVLYMNIRQGYSDKEFSDAYIVFDNTQSLMVVDPNHLFKDVQAKESFENKEYWAIFDIVFAKAMQKSDIIIDAWNQQRSTTAAKIVDALEINEPAIQLPSLKIIIPHEAASTTCKEGNSCFLPFNLEVAEGSTVTWYNEDSFVHTVTSGTPTSGPDTRFRDVLLPEESFDYTFCCKGTYKYYCEIHPWAVGLVTVKGDDPFRQENFEIKAYTSHGALLVQRNDVYEKEDILHIFEISGKINTIFGNVISISISKPDDQVMSKSIKADDKGHFSTVIVFDKTWKQGSYNISVKHQNYLIGSVSFTIV